MQQKVVEWGLTVIALVVAWRLLTGVIPVKEILRDPEVASFLIYMETGRVIRATEPTEQTTPPEAPTETEPAVAVFSGADASLVELYDTTGYEVETAALLETPLQWDLRGDAPTVLILHTHGTESYTKNGETYRESARYRTLDEHYNMIRVGDALAAVLESYGIGVIHDRTLHDYPSYTASYSNSRKAAQQYLEQYPQICLVLDVHRDAVELSGGRQMDTSAQVAGKESAQLMLVVGTDAGGLKHPEWQENLSVAAKLHVLLERANPGIMRPVSLRRERFNQDLIPGALLVEVGTAGNTLEEALTAAEALGHAIGAMCSGANLS